MTLRVDDDGAIRTLCFDNPGKKNALDPETLHALCETARETAYDDGVRVVVLTGAGSDFSSGADVAAIGARQSHPYRAMRLMGEAALALHTLPQPVIARVQGVAVGAGANLALACDFVVASATARFSQIFPLRGLSLDAGGSWFLPRSVGMLQAKRLAMLGEMIGAEEALQLGLATWVKAPEELDEFVAELCRRLAAGPPIALAQTKELLHRSALGSLEQAVVHEDAAQVVNFATDLPAAKRAFETRTVPEFTGEWHGRADERDR